MKKECYLIRVKYFNGRRYGENERCFVSSVDFLHDIRLSFGPFQALKFHSCEAASSFADGLNDLVLFTCEFEICHAVFEDSMF